MNPKFEPMTDGVVTIRRPRDGDAAIIVAGRDEEFHRWMASELELGKNICALSTAYDVLSRHGADSTI